MKFEFEAHQTDNESIFYFTLLKYYPIRFNVTNEYKINRKIVYDFKAGKANIEVDKRFITNINLIKKARPDLDYHLCPIPTSKVSTNTTRYKNFCERISTQAKINNGYEMIKPIKDRNEIHIGDVRDYSKVLNTIKFQEISGKNIFLIDDVVTKGRSFHLISNHLKSLGANYVIGIILAKTYWLDDQNESLNSSISDLPF